MEKTSVLNYAVFFLDLLGQQERYKAAGKGVPSTGANEFMSLVYKSLEPQHVINANIKKYVESTNKRQLDIPGHGKLELNISPVIGISDAVLIAVPLKHNINNRLPIINIHNILIACAATTVELLSKKCPLRGGCDWGWGVELDGQLHGYSLTSAYELESKIAKYPRIVLSKDIMNYIYSIAGETDGTLLGNLTKSQAEHCLKHIARDVDGQFVIDFLGEGFFTVAKGFDLENLKLMRGWINSASKFIDDTLKDATNKNQQALVSKYEYLRRYFDENMKRWFID